MTFIRCEDRPPTVPEVQALAAAWLAEHASPALVARMRAWDARICPPDVVVVTRAEVPGVDHLPLGGLGDEQLAAFRHATHAVSVAGRSDATGDGWLGVGAHARAVARAFDGVTVDHLTYGVRPMDERSATLAEVTLPELCGRLRIRQGASRWLCMTHGLGSLGIPEIWVEEVPDTQLAAAGVVLDALEEQLARRAVARRRADGGDTLEVGLLQVPEFGPVALTHTRHPLLNAHGLRATAAGRPGVPLGRLLARRFRHQRG